MIEPTRKGATALFGNWDRDVVVVRETEGDVLPWAIRDAPGTGPVSWQSLVNIFGPPVEVNP